MIFPISKVKYELIRRVYQDKRITISALLRATKVSPQSGYRYISELLLSGIIREKREGKKPTLRYLLPCFSETGKLCFALIEENKRINFLEKHPELKGPFEQFSRELGGQRIALLFGSFARGAETRESDLDLFLIGKKIDKKKIEELTERCFVTIKNPVSLRIWREKDVVSALKKEDAFLKQVEKEHILLAGSLSWVEMTGRVPNQL